MANAGANFNAARWEAELPKGKNMPKVVPGPNAKTYSYNFEPTDPTLVLDSIHSRPQRQLTAKMGPGAVIRTGGTGLGFRGSLEGPPFVGKVYDVSSDSQADEREGDTNKGRWRVVSKSDQLTTFTNLAGTVTRSIGKHEGSGGYHMEGWFEQPNLQDYIFTPAAAGGRRRSSRRSSSSKRRGTRRMRR